MACKAAVVTSSVGAIPEYAEDKKSAIFINPNSINSIFNGLESLIINTDYLKSISINGYENVKNKLDWNKSVESIMKVIK